MRVKTCCISSIDEARLAKAHGADLLGLVGHMPSGPGIISDDQISDIATEIRGISTVLLTSEETTEGVVNHWDRVRTSHIQIVRSIPVQILQRIKKELPAIPLLYVVHVENMEAITIAKTAADYADFILLDSGKPDTATPTLGGTGTTHDWSISARIVEQTNIPVFLAGGLTAVNVRRAISSVKPYGVDLCSGIRSEGQLDEFKLSSFMKAVKNTDE